MLQDHGNSIPGLPGLPGIPSTCKVGPISFVHSAARRERRRSLSLLLLGVGDVVSTFAVTFGVVDIAGNYGFFGDGRFVLPNIVGRCYLYATLPCPPYITGPTYATGRHSARVNPPTTPRCAPGNPNPAVAKEPIMAILLY